MSGWDVLKSDGPEGVLVVLTVHVFSFFQIAVTRLFRFLSLINTFSPIRRLAALGRVFRGLRKLVLNI